MKIGIARENAADAVLAHENGGVGIVEQVSAQMGDLARYLIGDAGVAVRFEQDADRR